MATTTKRKTTKATPATKKPARKVAHMGGTAAVNAYMAALVHPQKEVIEAVRAIVLKADKRMAERVKWNAPSFYITDASGTAQDFAAFNPRAKGFVQLILLFPMGVVDDPATPPAPDTALDLLDILLVSFRACRLPSALKSVTSSSPR